MKSKSFDELGIKKIDIEGYSGYYVSSKGKVFSTNNGGFKKLRPFKIGKYRNYLAVRLYKDKKGKDYKVHRLVGMYFIPNPKNLPQINHIDGNTFNNSVENLEWCTNGENQLHAWAFGLNHRTSNNTSPTDVSFMSITKVSKPIVQFDNDYNFIDIYGSLASCKNIANYSSINKCCNYETFHANNYKWRYINECNIRNKIIVISGKSASGKNFILEQCKQKFNMNELISYTTRPLREGEKEGKEYYFISEDEIKVKGLNGELLEIREYKTAFGKWYYGLCVKELKKNNPICILDNKGLKELEKKIGKQNIVSIFIDVKDKIRLDRSLNRENINELKKQEIIRRLEADNKDFSSEIINKNYDYIMQNNNIEDLHKILQLIESISKKNKKDGELFAPQKYRDGEFKYKNKYFYRYKDLCEYLNIPAAKLQYYRKKKKYDIDKAIKMCIKKEIS
ncbi:HNH endonuclease [Clostridium sardiniense]|uniref:HNH endonuclease n=1 Tax=Clostridium sardiniense TaxID=29369 RepID=UPI00195AC521|nr:HNH endonuclease [Clostridium sardiniense]MBM7836318.1 guanylate kinase [Clostridium sardiniense]